MAAPSPFLDPGPCSAANTLGILQLRRDHLIPAVLAPNGESDYAEGKVENTRFGSYPHSTLLNQPWGTQILASVVDTGSRSKNNRKRKREGNDASEEPAEREKKEKEKEKDESGLVRAATAASGFSHLIPPTPETWTLCLPHRTQVVYTPDYSYILQRLRVRPGDHIIEAGAGSGSFTHAAVRAVFNGYPGNSNGEAAHKKQKRRGGVYSFEYHAPRAKQLQSELEEHGLGSLVTVTNRDVYQDGFNLPAGTGPDADVIFLDLPAPWLALKHLTRSPPSPAVVKSVSSETPDDASTLAPTESHAPFRSPLNPKNAVRICTFSPCIEQVTKTVDAMRALGWLEIGMAEIQAKRLEVRRERVGLQEEGLRGANANPATVTEAVQRLRDVEGRAQIFHSLQKEKQVEVMRRAEARKRGEQVAGVKAEREGEKLKKRVGDVEGVPPSRHDRLEKAKKDLEKRELYKEGRLIHRTESELKTHTSYLVFAVLPREWTKEDEEKAAKKWS